MILPGETEHITPIEAAGLLHTLRWRPDQQIINHFGEYVWLKQVTLADAQANAVAAGMDPSGARAHITDCCFISDPCGRHIDTIG